MMDADALIWAEIWKWVLILGGAFFLGLFVYTVIVGAKDIRELFRALAGSEDPAPPPHEDDQT